MGPEADSDDEDNFNLAYEEMYEQLSTEKRSYKEHLHAVILGCVSLELSINQLVEIVVRKLPSNSLEKWAQNPNIPIHNKLQALRLANIISEELYNNLVILFKIRNRFAHDMPLPPKVLESQFELLKGVSIESKFVRELSNDSVKFQLVVSRCFSELLQIGQKIDPSSVLDLELVGDITPIED